MQTSRCLVLRSTFVQLYENPSFSTGALVVVDQPKVEPTVVTVEPEQVETPTPAVESPPIVALPEPKKAINKGAERLKKASIERGRQTDQAILDTLFSWSANPAASWGTIANLQDSLALRGTKLTIEVIREHVLKLADEGKLCVERRILDPQKKYKSGRKKIGNLLFTYLVSLNGDNGERGMRDYVITKFCDSYIERDENGRFIGIY